MVKDRLYLSVINTCIYVHESLLDHLLIAEILSKNIDFMVSFRLHDCNLSRMIYSHDGTFVCLIITSYLLPNWLNELHFIVSSKSFNGVCVDQNSLHGKCSLWYWLFTGKQSAMHHISENQASGVQEHTSDSPIPSLQLNKSHLLMFIHVTITNACVHQNIKIKLPSVAHVNDQSK